MRKFKVKVEIEKEYEIEVDDSIATDKELEDWERVFWDLDSEDTKIASYVSSYCELRAKHGNDFIEGFGIVLPKGMEADAGCNHMFIIKAR